MEEELMVIFDWPNVLRVNVSLVPKHLQPAHYADVSTLTIWHERTPLGMRSNSRHT